MKKAIFVSFVLFSVSLSLYGQNNFFFVDAGLGGSFQSLSAGTINNKANGFELSVDLGYRFNYIGVGITSNLFGLYSFTGDLAGMDYDTKVIENGIRFDILPYLFAAFNPINSLELSLGIGPHIGIYNYDINTEKTVFSGYVKNCSINTSTYGIGFLSSIKYFVNDRLYIGGRMEIAFDFGGETVIEEDAYTGYGLSTRHYTTKLTDTKNNVFKIGLIIGFRL